MLHNAQIPLRMNEMNQAKSVFRVLCSEPACCCMRHAACGMWKVATFKLKCQTLLMTVLCAASLNSQHATASSVDGTWWWRSWDWQLWQPAADCRFARCSATRLHRLPATCCSACETPTGVDWLHNRPAKWLTEWLNEWMPEWVNGWMPAWPSEWMLSVLSGLAEWMASWPSDRDWHAFTVSWQNGNKLQAQQELQQQEWGWGEALPQTLAKVRGGKQPFFIDYGD